MKKKFINSTIVLAILACLIAVPVMAEGDPVAITDFMVYYEDTGRVAMKYDILNDSTHYTEFAPPPLSCRGAPPANGSCQAGDPSLVKQGDTYYMVYRTKTPTGGDPRMKRIRCNSSTDLVNWTSVWDYHKTDIAHLTVASIERALIRYYPYSAYTNNWYLYFTYDLGGGNWLNSFVIGNNASQLGVNLTDATKWHNVTYSDPNLPEKIQTIVSANGSYWVFLNRGGAYQLVNAVNPRQFPTGWTNVSNLNSVYNASYTPPDQFKFGTVTYDIYSDYYILWASVLHGSQVYWWWAVSEDMTNWTNGGRKYIQSVGNCRFPALAVGSDVLALQWDQNEDSGDSVYLWNYPDDASKTIFSYFPLIIGLIAVITILTVAFYTRNPLMVMGAIVIVGLMALGAIMIINAFQGEGWLW